MSGKNVLDGFSHILDIQKLSGGGPPDTPWDPAETPLETTLEKWDTWSEPSFYKTFLLATTTSKPGGGGQTLNFRELGSTVKKCILLGFGGQAPQTHWKTIFKKFIFRSKRDWKKMKEVAGTKTNFWQRSSFHDL